jgi:hypothetical protein
MARTTWTHGTALAAVAALLATTAPASVKPCRDASGKIIRCADPKPAPKRCKDASGRFVRCPAPQTLGKASLLPERDPRPR